MAENALVYFAIVALAAAVVLLRHALPVKRTEDPYTRYRRELRDRADLDFDTHSRKDLHEGT